jgi:hypothetical protein
MNASAVASDLMTRAGKPAFITFHTVPRHLPAQSQREGRYIARDVDMVTVRQIGATDSVVFEVDGWLAQNKIEVSNGRLPKDHADLYATSYERWKSGQELPLEGTPIKTWPVISPAQVEALVRVGLRTVEDLASLNDEGLRKIGMGAVELRQKAKAWMAAAQDKGKLTQDMTALQRTNEQLHNTVASLTAKMEALQAEMKATKKTKGRKRAEDAESDISASDLIDE